MPILRRIVEETVYDIDDDAVEEYLDDNPDDADDADDLDDDDDEDD